MLQRHFYKKKSRYVYTPECPAIIEDKSNSAAAPYQGTVELSSEDSEFFTSFYPEKTPVPEVNTNDLLQRGVLEVYCSREFWETLPESDWIKLLEAHKDYLLVHNSAFWQNLSFQGCLELLKNGRGDLVEKHEPPCYTSKNTDQWVELLSVNSELTQRYFPACDKKFFQVFSPEQWYKILKTAPDFLLSFSPEVTQEIQEKVPGQFWVEALCKKNPSKEILTNCPWKRLSAEEWLTILCSGKYEYFNNCAVREEFTDSQWQQLLQKKPDVYLESSSELIANTLSISFWVGELVTPSVLSEKLLKQYTPWEKFSNDECFIVLHKTHEKYINHFPENLLRGLSEDQKRQLIINYPKFADNLNLSQEIQVEFWLEFFGQLQRIPKHIKEQLNEEEVKKVLYNGAGKIVFSRDDACLTRISQADWVELCLKDPALLPFASASFSRKRWNMYYQSRFAWFAIIPALILFTSAIFYGGGGIGVILIAAAASIFSGFLLKLILRSFFLSPFQSVLAILTGGMTLFLLSVVSAYSITSVGKFIFPAAVILSGILLGIIRFNAPIINCLRKKRCTLILILLPVLSAAGTVFWAGRSKIGIEENRTIGQNFRDIGLPNFEKFYMDRYVAQAEHPRKKLREFMTAVKNNKLSEALSAYEAIFEIWPQNPRLSVLTDSCVAMMKGMEISSDAQYLAEIMRAKKIFNNASDKNRSDLVDIELSVRSKQLDNELKKYQKQASYTSRSKLFKDWDQKIAAIESVDKNYASLNRIKASITKIQKNCVDEVKRDIDLFRKQFDKNFPPEKHFARLRRELPRMNDLHQSFSQYFSEYDILRYAWLLILENRQKGLTLLEKQKQSAAFFLYELFAGGTPPEKFSQLSGSDIFRALTLRKPAEAEKFFSFLIEQYNFNPGELYYLLAMSRKALNKPFAEILEKAILNNFPDRTGYYLAQVAVEDQKLPVLEKIVKDKMPSWKNAAVNLGSKYFAAGKYQQSFSAYQSAGEAAAPHTRMMNRAYFEANKEKILASIRKFILEFDRVYTNSSTIRPSADYEYKRCYEFLKQDFLWRYAWASYQHSRTLTERNEARALLEKIKSQEGVYLLAKIDNKGKELPVEAVQAGASASFKKIRLEATKYKLSSSRFASRDKIDGIRYLFEQGELSPQEKLYAGKFLMKQNDYMNARKIFDSLPESGDKAYQLFLCDLISGNKVSARSNLISALQKKYPVPYDEYKRIELSENKALMVQLVKNKGKGFERAALDFARLLASQKEWPQASVYFKIADHVPMTLDDKCNYGFSLWESGDKSSKCLEMCMKLPDERIGANLAWNIYLYLKNKKDTRSNLWLKSAAAKGSEKAENERYLFLRQDDSVENIAEKNKLWRNCILRGFKEAILDAVQAFAYGKPCPVSKDVIVRSGELFYSRLSAADKKKYSDLKGKLGIIKEL